jgi:putative CocE/NonD family hydrolase
LSPFHRILRQLLGLPRGRFASESSTHWLPLSDGVRLATTLIRPKGVGTERIPSVLIRTPLSTRRSTDSSRLLARAIAEDGYTVVLQECRGRYASEGRFAPFENEARDGEETLAWIAEQTWGGGPLGLVGFGYAGFAAWAALSGKPERIGAMVIGFHGRDPYASLYSGGALCLEAALHLAVGLGDQRRVPDRRLDLARGVEFRPVREADRVALRRADGFRSWTSHPWRDAYWSELSPALPARPPPTLLLAGWYDPALGPQLADYAELQRAAELEDAPAPELVVGPWAAGRDVGRGRNGRHRRIVPRAVLSFLDRNLRGGSQRSAPVRAFVHGADAWREFPAWPPPGSEERIFHLRSEGRANGLVGDGELSPDAPADDEAPDSFLYDPEDPVRTLGGFRIGRWGPADQRPVEARADVLCYSTSPLAADIDVVGPVRLVLFAASNAPDTDFAAKLVDVAPDGRAAHRCEGIVRARRQDEGATPIWFEADAPRRFEIDLWATSCRFRAGHRIRLEVTSSNFPRFDRNPNSRDEPETAGAEHFSAARQTVLHDAEHPSQLVLRVLAHGSGS